MDRPVCIVLFDVDHFKRLNDTYGHASGDEVIRKFAAMLRQIAPEGSVLGRIGGEEFALLLEGTTEEGASASAEAIRHTAATQSDKAPPQFTVSAGVAVVRAVGKPVRGHPAGQFGALPGQAIGQGQGLRGGGCIGQDRSDRNSI